MDRVQATENRKCKPVKFEAQNSRNRPKAEILRAGLVVANQIFQINKSVYAFRHPLDKTGVGLMKAEGIRFAAEIVAIHIFQCDVGGDSICRIQKHLQLVCLHTHAAVSAR